MAKKRAAAQESKKLEFNLERHLIPFLTNSTFYAELSRRIAKVSTATIPTAAVGYDMDADQITLYYNPNFMASLTDTEIRGVLMHEFLHVVFCHISFRRKQPRKVWNIATDLAINSIILHSNKSGSAAASSVEERLLPSFALVPGQWPVRPDGRQLTPEEKKSEELGALIAKLPTLQASELYFTKIMELVKEHKSKKKGQKGPGGPGGESGEGGEPDEEESDDSSGLGDWIDSLDDHAPWDAAAEELEGEYIESKIKDIVGNAVKRADQSSTGWGNMPAEIRDEIRKSVTNVINWRSVMRQFIGTFVRGHRTSSIKRINRRYPYIHPGTKRGYVAKLLIARDQSGSVSNEMCAEFFAELCNLTKKVDVDIINFDCFCSEKDIFKWKKGTVPEGASKRTRMGGTDFSAPTKIFNDPKNRGRWDGLLIMTDGEAPEPIACRGKRGWILANNCKLYFKSSELQIFVSKDKPMTGAWR